MFRTSCTECRRRKQKCSGHWPCRRCADRRLAHICHFETAPQQSAPVTASTLASPSTHTHPEDRIQACLTPLPNPKVLGYANGLKHLGWESIGAEATNCAEDLHPDSAPCQEMQNALQALPARSLTDMLVNRYLEHDNYTYYTIHAQSFLQEYMDWCNSPLSQRFAMKPFACLLLQVCALATQGLGSGALARHIEFELGEPTDTISRKFHVASLQLSKALKPGAGGVRQGLQLLLAATWTKSEGSIAEAWHHVAAASREEQECGMHQPEAPNGCSEIEIELRTRLWCSTVLWDWQMSEWLCRPLLIEQKESDLKIPNLKLDQIEGSTLSPFSSATCQYTLVQNLAAKFGRLSSPKKHGQVFQIQSVIMEWISALPAELALSKPDVSKDSKYPWILAQRTQLRCFVQMVKFMVTRSFILRPSTHVETHEQSISRQNAVTDALNCIDSALGFLQESPPPRARYHFVTFALFDTAAALCSAIIQDHENSLPSRERLLQAIGLAIDALNNIPPTNNSAAGAVKLLKWLSSQMPISREESSILQQSSLVRQADFEGSSDHTTLIPGPHLSSSSTLASIIENDVMSQADNRTSPEFLFGEAANLVDWGATSDIDLGTINEIWDYSSLNLPDYMQYGS